MYYNCCTTWEKGIYAFCEQRRSRLACESEQCGLDILCSSKCITIPIDSVSGQRSYLRRLIRACVARNLHKDPFRALCINYYEMYAQQRLMSACSPFATLLNCTMVMGSHNSSICFRRLAPDCCGRGHRGPACGIRLLHIAIESCIIKHQMLEHRQLVYRGCYVCESLGNSSDSSRKRIFRDIWGKFSYFFSRRF